jgi:hypothetical protein
MVLRESPMTHLRDRWSTYVIDVFDASDGLDGAMGAPMHSDGQPNGSELWSAMGPSYGPRWVRAMDRPMGPRYDQPDGSA